MDGHRSTLNNRYYLPGPPELVVGNSWPPPPRLLWTGCILLTPQLLILCPLQPRESHIKVGACRGVYQPHMGKLREKKTPTTGPILQTSIKKSKRKYLHPLKI